jgi:hypothetical protein
MLGHVPKRLVPLYNNSKYIYFQIYYVNRQTQILYFFLSLCASHEKFTNTVRKYCPAVLQKLLIIYISPMGCALEAFKVSMLILCKNFNWLMILEVVIRNVSKTGKTDVLWWTSYFVNKCSFIGAMSTNIWLK